MHSIDVVASSLGVLAVSKERVVALERREGEYAPMVVLQQGYLVTLAVALAGFGLACFWLLDVEVACPLGSWLKLLACLFIGDCMTLHFLLDCYVIDWWIAVVAILT